MQPLITEKLIACGYMLFHSAILFAFGYVVGRLVSDTKWRRMIKRVKPMVFEKVK